MEINKIIKIALGASALTVSVATSTQVSAVTIVNAGFEDETGWSLSNEAKLAETGGAAGWSWTTDLGNVITSTEAVSSTEGDRFGITFGNFDAFAQTNIATAGDYYISVDANALTGTAFVNPGFNEDLTDGAFQLFADGAFSPNMNVTTTDDWMTFTWTATLSEGDIDFGLRTTQPGIYSIAFDDFRITLVPVPAAVWLFGSGLIGLIGVARRKKA
jgi:hypothetical protein